MARELKLRKCSGNAFQEFFSDVMMAAHGSDFIRVRPRSVHSAIRAATATFDPPALRSPVMGTER